MLPSLLQYAMELANEKVSYSICISMHLKILFYTHLHVYLHMCLCNVYVIYMYAEQKQYPPQDVNTENDSCIQQGLTASISEC